MAQLGTISGDDFDVLESYYTARIAKDDDIRRRDVPTLLNNWSGELDRARGYLARQEEAAQADRPGELVT